MLADCFRGHGTFVYEAAATLDKYGNNPRQLVQALRDAGMTYVWVRLHDYQMKPEPERPTRTLIETLGAANIALAGWGFDTGKDPQRQAELAAGMVKAHGLTHYVADIEQDEHGSQWTVEKIPLFLQTLRQYLPQGAQIVVSSYPYIKVKHPELMRAAAPYADAFAPQIYWQDYPARYMLEPGNLPAHPSRPYDPIRDQHSPVAYAHLCLDWWQQVVGAKPLLMTGQAYWETISQAQAEDKLIRFLHEFDGWPRLVGANWWHLGHKHNLPHNGAMTPKMFQAIMNEQINLKPFRTTIH
jgi:hypothetical protein